MGLNPYFLLFSWDQLKVSKPFSDRERGSEMAIVISQRIDGHSGIVLQALCKHEMLNHNTG